MEEMKITDKFLEDILSYSTLHLVLDRFFFGGGAELVLSLIISQMLPGFKNYKVLIGSFIMGLILVFLAGFLIQTLNFKKVIKEISNENDIEDVLGLVLLTDIRKYQVLSEYMLSSYLYYVTLEGSKEKESC